MDINQNPEEKKVQYTPPRVELIPYPKETQAMLLRTFSRLTTVEDYDAFLDELDEQGEL